MNALATTYVKVKPLKITGMFYVKQRGPVFLFGPTSRDIDTENAYLRRTSDGVHWRVRGFERFCMHIGKKMMTAWEQTSQGGISVLLPVDCDLKVGDEVELFNKES